MIMLKFLVKYTDMNINGPWIRRFLEQPLPEEVRELETLYEALHMKGRMARYWTSQQKQRYGSYNTDWLHKLDPINAQMWTIKQLYKLRQPNAYQRKKAMWHAMLDRPLWLVPNPTAMAMHAPLMTTQPPEPVGGSLIIGRNICPIWIIFLKESLRIFTLKEIIF